MIMSVEVEYNRTNRGVMPLTIFCKRAYGKEASRLVFKSSELFRTQWR